MKQVMRIAILGATSQIAKDLVLSFASNTQHELRLFARRPEAVKKWMSCNRLSNLFSVGSFDEFGVNKPFDAILNFVGVGNPAQAVAMGGHRFLMPRSSMTSWRLTI